MNTIKPIETVYNGYRFRSRLEARWAVFFDAAGIEYQYEPEGFDLGDGYYYLPDFYLPNDDVWVEIKGKQLTREEREKIERFCTAKCDFAHGGSRFRLLEGQIPDTMQIQDATGGRVVTGIPIYMYVSRDEFANAYSALKGFRVTPSHGILLLSCWVPGCSTDIMIDALTKARQARFEHGEHGAVS